MRRPGPSNLRSSRCFCKPFWLAIASCLAFAGDVAEALAQTIPDRSNENGKPFRSSDYSIDLFQGPVLAGTRITGLSGAYTALAEGVEGHRYNAAAPAVRSPTSTNRVDWDVDAGLSLAPGLKRTDFDNNGKTGFNYNNFFFASLGGQVQVRRLGFGANVNIQQYKLDSTADGGSRTLRSVQLQLLTAYSFAEDQLVIGAGFRVLGLYLLETQPLGEKVLFSTVGVGGELGALLAPDKLPLRFGATVRTPIVSAASPSERIGQDEQGNFKLGSAYLPAKVHVPWEIEGGIAFSLGKRPINQRWFDRERISDEDAKALVVREGVDPKDAKRMLAKRRYQTVPRDKFLVSGTLLMTGITPKGVGFESFLSQTVPVLSQPKVVERSGERLSLTPRLGVEAEPIDNRLQVRVGGYLEPSRFREGSARMHGTLGFNVKIFESTFFGFYDKGTPFAVGFGTDFSARFFSWGISAGIWR
jgi:hypothetical protein